MSDADRRPSHEHEHERELAPAERLLRERTADLPGIGKPLTERARIAQRSVESYLLGANNPPRWMERVAEIDRALRRERRMLRAEWQTLRAEHGADGDGFASAWRAFAAERGASREYRELNELIRAHNEWYPIERNLPVNPRTGEWVTVGGGRSCGRWWGRRGCCGSSRRRSERRPAAPQPRGLRRRAACLGQDSQAVPSWSESRP